MVATQAHSRHAPARDCEDVELHGDGDAASGDGMAMLLGRGRRRAGEPVSDLLKKSQAKRLERLSLRNRILAADDMTNLLFERLGLIQRVGEVHLHRLRGYPAVEWAITKAGQAALREVDSRTHAGAMTIRSDRRSVPAPEIVGNVAQAAIGLREVTADVAGAAQVSEERGAVPSRMPGAASKSSHQPAPLTGGRFLAAVRAT